MALSRKAIKREYLFPRTATTPIQLCEYVERSKRSRVIDNDRLTPEWRKWFDRQIRKGSHECD